MTTMSTNEFSGLLRPDDLQQMLLQPLEEMSIAALATTFVYTGS